jgi:hypothetical protein
MACSVCGNSDHNARTCPSKKKGTESNRDYTFWVKIDNITEKESRSFGKEIIDLKQKIAPEGRATAAMAHKSQLPETVKKALEGRSSGE